MENSSWKEQLRLAGLRLSLRDEQYLDEKRKKEGTDPKVKQAIREFQKAVKLFKKGKITSKELDAAENKALDAGADFTVIDKMVGG